MSPPGNLPRPGHAAAGNAHRYTGRHLLQTPGGQQEAGQDRCLLQEVALERLVANMVEERGVEKGQEEGELSPSCVVG